MIFLIISKDQTTLESLTVALRETGLHQFRTAPCLDSAWKMASEMEHLDVLIDTTETVSSINDKLVEKFSNLKSCELRKSDLLNISEWASRNQFFDKPHVQKKDTRSPQEQGTKPNNDTPIIIEETAADEEIPLANTLTIPGKKLGDYELLRFVTSDGETEIHEALQVSIDRKVKLILLNPKLAGCENSVNAFRELVRAKAKVSHPHIASIYEGYEEEGALFYTSELIVGKNLQHASKEGIKFSDATLIRMVKTIVETQSYLKANKIKHQSLKESHIYLSDDGTTRIANTANNSITKLPREKENIRKLGELLYQFVDPKESKTGAKLLAHMRHASGPATWGTLRDTVMRSEEKLSQISDFSIASKEDGSRRSWRRIAVGIIIATATALIYLAQPDSSPQQTHDQGIMIRISGGEFLYQKETIKTLPTYWIDKHEVSIAEYKEFLDALESSNFKHLDHPKQPTEKFGHRPKNWADYYNAAQFEEQHEGHPINLNCPVIYVDWWDAYAYAKWKKRRLPSEEEWEKAGRGRKGNFYSWGNTLESSKLTPDEDRFKAWKPVDSVKGDLSAQGVVGLTGNVSEWTSSLEPDPEIVGKFVPIVRGGNFLDPNDKMPNLTTRKTLNARNESTNYIGFRTVSDTDPALETED